MNTSIIFSYVKRIKTFLKIKEYVGRDIKTEKAQKQDWDGTLATKFN